MNAFLKALTLSPARNLLLRILLRVQFHIPYR